MLMVYFIDEKSKEDGSGKTENNLVYIEKQGIPDKPQYIRAAQKFFEMLKSYPTAPEEPQGRLVILKSNNSASHWYIMKNEVKYRYRNKHEVDILVLLEILVPALCPILRLAF
jgi:hypothetical protein